MNIIFETETQIFKTQPLLRNSCFEFVESIYFNKLCCKATENEKNPVAIYLVTSWFCVVN